MSALGRFFGGVRETFEDIGESARAASVDLRNEFGGGGAVYRNPEERYRDKQVQNLKDNGVSVTGNETVGQLHDLSVAAAKKWAVEDLAAFRADNAYVAPTPREAKLRQKYSLEGSSFDQANVVFGTNGGAEGGLAGTPEASIIREAEKNEAVAKELFRPAVPAFSKEEFKASVAQAKRMGDWKNSFVTLSGAPRRSAPNGAQAEVDAEAKTRKRASFVERVTGSSLSIEDLPEVMAVKEDEGRAQTAKSWVQSIIKGTSGLEGTRESRAPLLIPKPMSSGEKTAKSWVQRVVAGKSGIEGTRESQAPLLIPLPAPRPISFF